KASPTPTPNTVSDLETPPLVKPGIRERFMAGPAGQMPLEPPKPAAAPKANEPPVIPSLPTEPSPIVPPLFVPDNATGAAESKSAPEPVLQTARVSEPPPIPKP